MQVDRQPSPWPCVAMLVGLLLFCLAVPRYWRNGRSDSSEYVSDIDSPVLNKSVRLPIGMDGAFKFGIQPAGPTSDNNLLPLFAAPTVEELIAERVGIGQVKDDSTDWPTFGPPVVNGFKPSVPAAPPDATVAPGPLVTGALQHVGRTIAIYSTADVAPQVVEAVVDLYRKWAISTPPPAAIPPPRSTVRVLSPNDRLAMIPTPSGSQQRSRSVIVESDAWCTPEVLLEQLERLAQHPDSARWAEQTIAQLRGLTQRGRLEGDDVPTILANLSDSTQEALRMADATDDDRLRVELLRAHWGLARRLDCWGVIHEIRVADRARERLALHGPLGSFFQNANRAPVEPASGSTLTTNLETYERSRDPQLGRQIVQQQQSLASSAESLDRALADSVEQHYRNANIRVAITAAMLNRLMAGERSEVRALRARIAGTPVRGRSHVQSTSRVRLEPATGRWQMGVEAEGLVQSHTVADGGQARLRSRSGTDYAASKSIVVDPNGVVSMQPTVVNATTHNRLVGVTTDFDWVPLFGSLARDRAKQAYRARQARTRREVEFKVSSQAVEQIDRETRDIVARIERQVRRRFTDRLAASGVELTPVEMSTTEERVVARLRVAGDHQLGSHTPRPRALSDSLASVQVHETALTNAAVSLELDGRSYAADELEALFRAKFPNLTRQAATNRRDAVFHFAAEDAVKVYINDGQLEITMTLARVELDGRNMRNFVVHAYFVPVVRGLEAELVRDGSLGIEGKLSSSQRARLHNVFNSVLPPERRLPILRLDEANDLRLDGLMITQLVLEDGWLGLAIGPAFTERVAERSRSLR